ncbi:hypothetical protein B0O99DRAFT_89227 [Bisporella sp. PMI_857]|nr:hypothetical protein B0O99DRAFT_89227 [Bisporella sp. PMI_857]
MPSPIDSTQVQQKRKKACQRCRHRKQRCDFQQPCHNCQAAGVECLAVIPEPYQSYPTGYVQALEHHAAMLEHTLNEKFPGIALDHLEAARTQQELQFSSAHPMQSSTAPQTRPFSSISNPSPQAEQTNPWQQPSQVIADPSIVLGGLTQNQPSPPDFASLRVQPFSPTSLRTQIVSGSSEGMDDIPTSTAASFFRTYFSCVHPQYPFLSVADCANWYTEWKMAPAGNPISGWPAFFVKMIFAIGSLIQSKSDNAPRYQHQDLKSQAQSEDSIIRSTDSSSLVRLQAMLLSAMYAIHSESTARIAHISGAIMRFATLHGFHQLIDLSNDESDLKTKVWSSAYVLDRAVNGTLDIPNGLADIYISSSLFVNKPQLPCHLPWLDDAQTDKDNPHLVFELGTFAHICKVRLLQSYINHTMQAVPLEGGATSEWVESMRMQIEHWASDISSHSVANTEGYQSPLWLGLISQLSRLLLCRPSRVNINTHVSDVALRAACEACTTFRALQKKRQIAQPWMVVITQFQAGVTILYIIWARAIHPPKEVDLAIRDCTSVLAILAERWQNAECYRDCFEVLARGMGGIGREGWLDPAVRGELVELTGKVTEAGCHRHVQTMLWDMAAPTEEGRMEI